MKRSVMSELVEGFESTAKKRQQHTSVARDLASAGLRRSPNPGEAGVLGKQQQTEVFGAYFSRALTGRREQTPSPQLYDHFGR